MVKDRVSQTIDKGYNEVISLQYDKRTTGHEMGGKVEINSFLMIVLQLTCLSIENQRELTRASIAQWQHGYDYTS